MDEKEKEEFLEALEEVKELVDNAFPLESSVVRDQVLAMLAVTTLQGAMLKRLIGSPAAGTQFDFRRVLDWLNTMFAEYKVIQHENVIVQRERIAARLTAIAAQKGKEWAWEAYQEFMGRQGI
jgi:hypothetical protein